MRVSMASADGDGGAMRSAQKAQGVTQQDSCSKSRANTILIKISCQQFLTNGDATDRLIPKRRTRQSTTTRMLATLPSSSSPHVLSHMRTARTRRAAPSPPPKRIKATPFCPRDQNGIRGGQLHFQLLAPKARFRVPSECSARRDSTRLLQPVTCNTFLSTHHASSTTGPRSLWTPKKK